MGSTKHKKGPSMSLVTGIRAKCGSSAKRWVILRVTNLTNHSSLLPRYEQFGKDQEREERLGRLVLY